MKYGNLHLHSVYSDSQFTPYQLVLIGKSLGYRALALTDHWSDGGFDEFSESAKAEGIDVISGVEFDSSDLGASIHITALDFDRDNPKMRAMIKDSAMPVPSAPANALNAVWLLDLFRARRGMTLWIFRRRARGSVSTMS